MRKGVNAEREGNFLLAAGEKRLTTSIARRLPRWVLPDDLTLLGVLSSIGIFAAYILSNNSPVWLLVVCGLLIIHWFGDSLDGTLARTRQITRPKYGFYLDHLVDAFSTVLIILGLGLSPYISMEVAAFICAAYLALSINVYLEAMSFGNFSIGYGLIGPTEIRILLATLNLALFFGLSWQQTVFSWQTTTLDIPGIILASAMFVALAIRGFRNLRHLAADEPSAKRK